MTALHLSCGEVKAESRPHCIALKKRTSSSSFLPLRRRRRPSVHAAGLLLVMGRRLPGRERTPSFAPLIQDKLLPPSLGGWLFGEDDEGDDDARVPRRVTPTG